MSDTPRTDAVNDSMSKDIYDKMERLRSLARQLERELNEALEQNKIFRNAQKACEDCDAPTMAEAAELRKDKERWDWLEKNTPKESYHNNWRVQAGDEESNYGLVRGCGKPSALRQAIDAAMKGSQ